MKNCSHTTDCEACAQATAALTVQRDNAIAERDDAAEVMTKHRALEPHIYSVDCTYRGTMVNFHDDSEESNAASRANMNAEKLVVAAMVKIGMMCFHQYSWPDGSLYKWGMFVDGSSPSPRSVADSLNRELPQNGDVYVSVTIDDSRQDPHKVGYKTLRAYAVPKNAEVIRAQNSM